MEKIVDLAKVNTLAEISRDIGQVLFAGVVVGPFISRTSSITMLIMG